MTSSFAIHKHPLALVAGIGLFLVFNSSRVYIDKLNNDRRSELKSIAIRGLLRVFTTSMFGEGSGVYRATILTPTKDGDHICPTYRYQYGDRNSKSIESSATFAKGSALAGFAWDDPATPFMRDDIGPFASREQYIHYYKTELQMPDHLVQRLGIHVTSKVRGIFCVGLVNHADEFLGVLSIDSTKPGTFERLSKERVKQFRAALAATLEEV